MSESSSKRFFDEQRESSLIKTRIVAKYFSAWAKIMLPRAARSGGRIAYIDLFAGQGFYDDGAESTPLWVLRHAVSLSPLREQLVTWFNDSNELYVDHLQEAVSRVEGIEGLKYQPHFTSYEVGEEVISVLRRTRVVPTLFFVDPWGYRGLSLELLGAAIRDWGCDCIFFFNYNRINPGLSNPSVAPRMDEIFGAQRADDLRGRVSALKSSQREQEILNELPAALREVGGQYVLPFCFKADGGRRTSHHLILVTKHARGYHIMKDIMEEFSLSSPQGVPSFEFDPSRARQVRLELERPLDELKEELLRVFAGRTLSMGEIYNAHNVGTKYIERNYKEALSQLEMEHRIVADPPAERRQLRKSGRTFGNPVMVSFP